MTTARLVCPKCGKTAPAQPIATAVVTHVCRENGFRETEFKPKESS